MRREDSLFDLRFFSAGRRAFPKKDKERGRRWKKVEEDLVCLDSHLDYGKRNGVLDRTWGVFVFASFLLVCVFFSLMIELGANAHMPMNLG